MGETSIEQMRISTSNVHSRWNMYFAIATPLLIASIVLLSKLGWYQRFALVILLGLPTLVFLLFVDPYSSEHAATASKSGYRGWCFAALSVVCLVAAAAINPSVVFMQFIVVPQLFIAFTYWPSLGVVTLMNCGFIGVAWMQSAVLYSGDITDAVVESVASVFFSGMIGIANDHLVEVNTHNIQLIERLQSQQEVIGHLSHEEGIAAERQRMAGEMHDTIAQSLTSMLALSRAALDEMEDDQDHELAAKHLRMISTIAKESLDDTRALIANSTPVALQKSGLRDALNRTLANTQLSGGIAYTLHVDEHLPVLPLALQVAVLRVVQEAATNIQKHSRAHHVNVELKRVPGDQGGQERLCLCIEDDGIGFDASTISEEQASTTGHGYGFIDMRRRVEGLSGRFSYSSSIGEGTHLLAVFPLQPESSVMVNGVAAA
ncbi:sensor histidine kinase [Bifidobacterium sp.]|jgi:signal transduction histidine kinase|uniref:sensor histidine kinase n=1 Tax=Bifidobacterium sp. TaxID=41200 RepID=UPI0025C19B25|nr:sensor histidine kinase [Bifidobacterium sp.]MCI1636234.1 sensor histidine kinase [Bifidobacterium sp.]